MNPNMTRIRRFIIEETGRVVFTFHVPKGDRFETLKGTEDYFYELVEDMSPKEFTDIFCNGEQMVLQRAIQSTWIHEKFGLILQWDSCGTKVSFKKR